MSDATAPPRSTANSSQSDEIVDPFRFQAHRVPAELRAEMVFAKLPQLEPGQLEDTVPPNQPLDRVRRRSLPAIAGSPLRRAQTVISRRKARERQSRWLGRSLLAIALVGPLVIVAAVFGLLLR